MATQPIDVKTRINLPTKDGEVFVVLVEQGAVPVSYGIELYRGSNKVRDVVPFGDNPINTSYSLGPARDLRGLSTDCFGRVFYPGERSVTFRCDFVMDGKVFASSDDAVIKLTAAAPSREFHIRCLFQ